MSVGSCRTVVCADYSPCLAVSYHRKRSFVKKKNYAPPVKIVQTFLLHITRSKLHILCPDTLSTHYETEDLIMKFYRCEHCGNIITHLHNANVPVFCCGRKMMELVPGAVDGSAEKHVPVILRTGDTVHVKVGSVEHPMLPEHFIQWIVLETKYGFQVRCLSPGQKPEAVFYLADGDSVTAAYEYCNIHGLWMA